MAGRSPRQPAVLARRWMLQREPGDAAPGLEPPGMALLWTQPGTSALVFYLLRSTATCPPALPSHQRPIQGCHIDQEETLSMGFGITEALCALKSCIEGGNNEL